MIRLIIVIVIVMIFMILLFFSALISELNALYISCEYFQSKGILIKDIVIIIVVIINCNNVSGTNLYKFETRCASLTT